MDVSRLAWGHRPGRLLAVAAFACAAAVTAPPLTAGQPLRAFSSRHYDVQTNAGAKDAHDVAGHMDQVFDEYARRFRAFGDKTERMPLYLFKVRQDYLDFLRSHGIDGSATGGIFFIRPNARGLATWLDDRPRRFTLETLQHEGFHQFAHSHIGAKLPVWVNEGLAEYFGDALLVGDTLRIGIASGRRIMSVRNALDDGRVIDFDKLLVMTPNGWQKNLTASRDKGRLQYDQSWSMIYFLIHGDDGRYRQSFEQYLQLVSHNVDGAEAFTQAFGAKDTRSFRRRWEKFATAVEPDALDTAVSRMRFLGQGLTLLVKRREPAPQTIDELRQKLVRIGFRAVRIENGVRIEVTAADPSLYQYPRNGNDHGAFTLLAPAASSQPPRITALGLQPEPMLIWSKDHDGQFVADIKYK